MKIIQRVNAMIEDLNRWQSIPTVYESILEERLFLVCKPPDRLKREKTRRSRSEYNSHARENMARNIYLEVLAKFPLTFLPFLLVISPGSCRNWKTGQVESALEGCRGKQLDREFQAIPRPRPRKISETEDGRLYNAADVSKSRKFFNENIFKAIEDSPKRSHEKESNLHRTTHCIRMSFSRSDQQDAIIRLDIGFDSKIIKALFPNAWQKFTSIYGVAAPSQHGNPGSFEAHVYDNACFTFQGAYVPSILEVFGPHIHQAIEESQLRRWETDSFLLKTTDCISLDIGRSHPYEGIMSLRVCSSHAIFMATKIYSCDD
ncbi:hypothetical protein BDW75DRAFT_235294 [Aspergillus navahoensis]